MAWRSGAPTESCQPGGGGMCALFSLTTYSLISLLHAGEKVVVVVVLVVLPLICAKATPAKPESRAASRSFFIGVALPQPSTSWKTIRRRDGSLPACQFRCYLKKRSKLHPTP